MCLGRGAREGTYLQAQFFRLKARRGPKKAAIAVAASILTAAYHMLKEGTFYQDPRRKLALRTKDLGYDVQYQAAA
jgi:transposase